MQVLILKRDATHGGGDKVRCIYVRGIDITEDISVTGEKRKSAKADTASENRIPGWIPSQLLINWDPDRGMQRLTGHDCLEDNHMWTRTRTYT